MVKSPSLAEQAFERLEHALVTLQLPPGETVREQQLAAVAGIGRTPVREAILRLADMGLLRILPRKGVLVAPIVRTELQQVLEVRRVLERLLVVKACERATTHLRQKLKELPERLRMVSATGDLTTFFFLDRQLDAWLTQAAANRHLTTALEPLQVHCRRFWFLRRNALALPEAAERHAALAMAVSTTDNAGAVRSINGMIAQLEGQLISLDNPD